jgi:hypothetical protein
MGYEGQGKMKGIGGKIMARSRKKWSSSLPV